MSLPSSSACLSSAQKSLQEFVCLEEGIASPSLALAMAGLLLQEMQPKMQLVRQGRWGGKASRVALVLEAPETYVLFPKSHLS